MIDYIVLAVIMSPALCAIFILFRNVWLFNRLMKLGVDDSLKIKLTYGQMVLRFWVWDVRKFISDERAGA